MKQEFKPKSIIFDEKTDDALLNGAAKIAKAVCATMGACGDTVILGDNADQLWPKVTKDGVTVAREITIGDTYEKVGADLLRQAANCQLHDAGDGTTLTVLLAYEIYRKSIKYIKSGIRKVDLVREMDTAVDLIIKQLKDQTQPCEKENVIKSIAKVSANGDEELGGLIAEAMLKVGKYGVVGQGRSLAGYHQIEHVNSYSINNGIQFKEFMNDNGYSKLVRPHVLVTDQILQYGTQISKIVKAANERDMSKKRPIVIFSPEIKDEALQAIASSCTECKEDNKIAFIVWIRPSKPLGTFAYAQEMQDIAALTKGTYLNANTFSDINKIDPEYFGACKLIESSKEKTLIIEGSDKSGINLRLDELKSQLNKTSVAAEKETMKQSIAKLNGGVAIIKIHSNSESEAKEILDRLDDAVRATKCAIEHGYVEGGGVAFLNIKKKILGEWQSKANTGLSLLLDVLEAPCRKIINNSGYSPDLIIEKILEGKKDFNGYDLKGGFAISQTMKQMGVIDPSLVIEKALLNAYSVAKLMIKSSVLVVNTE